MAQVINTNVSALFAGAALNKSNLALQTAMQRLSSGLRINSAKDDPTGLATATGYDTSIRATNVTIRMANDAVSLAQNRRWLSGPNHGNLQRMSEVLKQVPAGNAETTALIAENTRYYALVINSVAAAGVRRRLTAPPSLTGTTASVAADLTAVTTSRATFGADMSKLASTVATLQTASVNLSAAYSRIMDTDYATETTAMTRNQILQQAGTAMLAQANQIPNMVLTLLK
jgi:flagellin